MDKQICPSGHCLASLGRTCDAKTVTLGTDLSVLASHSCQTLIVYPCKPQFYYILKWGVRGCKSPRHVILMEKSDQRYHFLDVIANSVDPDQT